ncbi:MAG: 2,3-bisphosphoglycerate-independent phosphoglycerate mutase [Clostridiales bacterium]
MKFVGKPLLLMILDGWGMPNGAPGDALSLAHLPNFHRLWENYPHTTLGASGPYVGLPEGQMGDSEVGHMNIGSGRIIYQDFTRISKAIENGDFFDNPIFTESLAKTKKIGGALHIYGLLSDGGIHSHLSHLLALLNMAKKQQVKEVFVHCFADGRDTPPRSVGKYIKILEAEMARLQIGRIASLIGRFYAMDRDKHWERVASAYNLLVYGQGKPFSSALDAVEASYEQDITDEFMKPAVMVDDSGQPLGLVKEGDTIIFYNYRSDRAREISHAFADSSFDF